jgi:hypothetical protein
MRGKPHSGYSGEQASVLLVAFGVRRVGTFHPSLDGFETLIVVGGPGEIADVRLPRASWQKVVLYNTIPRIIEMDAWHFIGDVQILLIALSST